MIGSGRSSCPFSLTSERRSLQVLCLQYGKNFLGVVIHSSICNNSQGKREIWGSGAYDTDVVLDDSSSCRVDTAISFLKIPHFLSFNCESAFLKTR